MSDEPLADIAQAAVLDTNAVTKVFIKIRDKRAQLKKAFEDEDKVLKEKQVILEGAMLDFLQLHNLRSAPTDNGVFYRRKRSSRPASTGPPSTSGSVQTMRSIP